MAKRSHHHEITHPRALSRELRSSSGCSREKETREGESRPARRRSHANLSNVKIHLANLDGPGAARHTHTHTHTERRTQICVSRGIFHPLQPRVALFSPVRAVPLQVSRIAVSGRHVHAFVPIESPKRNLASHPKTSRARRSSFVNLGNCSKSILHPLSSTQVESRLIARKLSDNTDPCSISSCLRKIDDLVIY